MTNSVQWNGDASC